MNCDCQISVDWLRSPPAQPIDLGLLCWLGHRCWLSPHNYCSSGNGVYRSAGYTWCTTTHTYPDTLHRDAHPHRHTPSQEGSFILNGKKRKLSELCHRFGHARVDGGGRIKVLSCKIKMQPSSSVQPQGMVRIEPHRRCEMKFASVLTDPCVRECVTAYESK